MVEELQIVFVFHEVCERPELLLPSDNWKFSANLDHEHTVVDLRHGAHRVHHQLPSPGGQLGAGVCVGEAPRDEVVLIRHQSCRRTFAKFNMAWKRLSPG